MKEKQTLLREVKVGGCSTEDGRTRLRKGRCVRAIEGMERVGSQETKEVKKRK